MKKLTLLLLTSAFVIVIQQKASAQLYKAAAGLKFTGYENGVSGKYFLNENNAVEGILGIRSHGVVLTGLYQIHQTVFDVPELKFYYGFGAHLGAIGDGHYRRFVKDDDYGDAGILIGADGVVGMEYLIPETPIAISFDLNPRLELGRGPFFDLSPGLGLKYTFKW
ncbi:hypothetical protein LLH06_05045 [Mucilaginibacter daejeonensis]|uniref:hypothetical protein n=1 Tax=Mucilaginibacter daejeonensis TaxID=398049 RepID=UPI001D17254E|nr:hypothetical protein [Mucilaginibacter daejeonensis]UEG54332.1 hypothetical protein LLH06_05045 [Mucilaginibacter daejeonensis]